jgi:NADP-reducing hydrogenase subunit HndB
VKTVEDLERIRKQAKAMTRLRESAETTKIVVAMGTCGIAAGARETLSAIMDELARRNLQDVIVTQTGCIGLCEQEPIIAVMIPGREKVSYGRVSPEKARQIVASHVVNGQVVGEWVIPTG